MKRLLLALTAATLMAALAPASALAHHRARGHRGLRHHRVHIRRLGSFDSMTSTSTPSSGIGTVSSFQNGVLTITLNDNSTVTGNVTGDTQMACMTSGAQQSSSGDGEDSSNQTQSSSGETDSSVSAQQSGSDQASSGGGDQSSSGSDQTAPDSDQSSGDDDQVQQSSGGTDQSTGDDSSQGSASSCSPATGMTVLAGALLMDSTGNTWERIDLGS